MIRQAESILRSDFGYAILFSSSSNDTECGISSGSTLFAEVKTIYRDRHRPVGSNYRLGGGGGGTHKFYRGGGPT